ncbi:MAG: hypothetical protein V1689_11110 [Pseudomonadota bacterium]
MDKKKIAEEIENAVHEFQETFNAFEKAAKRLMAIMQCMHNERRKELEAISGNTRRMHEFLVQMMDESGDMVEKCFGIRCVAEKVNKNKDKDRSS